MYYLNSYLESITTLVLLIKSKLPNIIIKDINDLKLGYLSLLKIIQPKVWHPSEGDDVYLYDTKLIKLLSDHHNEDPCPLTDKGAIIEIADHHAMETALSEIEKGFKLIHQGDEKFYSLAKTVTNTIYYARTKGKEGGGSVSSAIGTLWCANRKNWEINDLAEFIVHETTHTLVFLDELRFSHYVSLSELSNKDNYALSSVLKIKRPLDKVFHSLIVAFEILSLREDWLGHPESPKIHPPSSEIYRNCINTIISLRDVCKDKNLVTKRVVDLVDKVQQHLETKFSHFAKKIA